MMKSTVRLRSILCRIQCVSCSYSRFGRYFCECKPLPSSSKNGSRNHDPTTSSLSTYKEQYKALDKLDFMTATRILFSEKPKKKKFGLDFHLVQLFFACLPSLAVYLVAKYARSKMKKMDAELEKRKQAEFEAQVKEMERKAAEDKAAVASNPAIMEVKERLDKLESTLKEIIQDSRKQPSNDSQKDEKQQGAQTKPSKDRADDSTSKETGGDSSNEKPNLPAPVSQADNQKGRYQLADRKQMKPLNGF